MSDDTRAVLLRLNRRIGREAALHERFEREAYAKGNAMSRERAYGEANVLRMAQDFIDDELRKVASYRKGREYRPRVKKEGTP